jgi:hypothetical protein
VSLDPLADAALDATFTALAVTVTYQPLLGAPLTVDLHRLKPVQVLDGLGGGRQLHDGLIVQIRASDLPEGPPVAGDLITADGKTYRVRSAQYADAQGLVWAIEAVPA